MEFDNEEIPKGWINIIFKRLIKKIPLTGKKIKQKEYLKEGTIPIIDQGQEFIGGYTEDARRIVNCNLPVIVFGDHTKSIKFVDREFVAGADGIKVLEVNSSLNQKLLYYFMQAIQLPDRGYARHYQYLEKTIVPIPPLNEQRRIVSKIESIFAQIDAAKEILLRLQGNMQSRHTSLASLKSSVLKQAFEGRLVPQDPDDESAEDFLHKIHKNSKKELIFEEDNMPRGWVKTSLDSVSHIILGQSPPSSTYNLLKDGLPFFQGKTDFGVLHPKTRVWCSSPKKIAEKNDLLLSVRAPVGSTNLSKERCCIGRGLAAIRSINCDMPIMFFVYFFRHIENYLENQGTGTTFKAISGKQIRDLRIPLPPLNEQKRIVAKIESIFGNIDTLNLFCFILRGNLFTNLRYFMILYMLHLISEQ